MSNTPTPKPRFTGIFIPAEILEREELTLMEKFLLSWIDALYCKNHGGCFASNEYLASKLGAKENTVAKSLTKLRKLNLLADVSFDGRTRVIRATLNEAVAESQSNAGLDKNPKGVGFKSNADMDKNPSSPIIYSKEESKDKNIAQSGASHEHEQRPEFAFSSSDGKFKGITKNDIDAWKLAFPDIDISQEIIRAEQWVLSNPTKSRKKLWRKFLTSWFSRANEKAENKKAYRSQTGNNPKGKLRGWEEAHPKDEWTPSNWAAE